MNTSRSAYSKHKNRDTSLSHQERNKIHNYKTNEPNQIAYSIFPLQNLNSSVNVHKKCTNQYSSNFKTLAYEKFVMGKEPETQADRNFVKNYYLQNVPQKMSMTNQIVKQLQEEVFPFNAYVFLCQQQNLAEGATKDYLEFQYKRQQYLLTARKRAKDNTKQYFTLKQEQSKANLQQRQKWIQKILSTIQDLGQRMFGLSKSNKQNEQQNGKQRIFLNQKSYVNEKYLQNFKIKDVQTSKKIFQDLRALMLRKKRILEDERIKNKSIFFLMKDVNLTMSQLSETASNQSSVSQSMISAVSEVDGVQNQQKMISELCDFENLKRKWKCLDVQKIKDMIVRTVTRRIITDWEAEKAKKISSRIKQSNQIPKRLKSYSDTQKKQKREKPFNKKSKQQQLKVINRSRLSKQEHEKKQQLLKGGQYAVAGMRYQNVKNYSDLFRKKQKDMKLDFSFAHDRQINDLKNHLTWREKVSQQNQQTAKIGVMKGYRTTRATSLRN